MSGSGDTWRSQWDAMQRWHLNGSCNTAYRPGTASSHWRLENRRERACRYSGAAAVTGCSLLLCWSLHLQTEMCPGQRRLLGGSLAHSGSSLGCRDHIHITEALHQELLCCCSASLLLGRAECALLCNLWRLFLYCMQNRNGLYKDILALTLQMSQHLRLSSQCN